MLLRQPENETPHAEKSLNISVIGEDTDLILSCDHEQRSVARPTTARSPTTLTK